MLERFLVDRRFRAPRLWSNRVLRQVAPLFGGQVINVSAWNDADKQGDFYRNYFTGAESYTLSNYGGYRGSTDGASVLLDLEGELPLDLRGAFDVVYNHTTLEHVFNIFKAVENLCLLSRDVVIVVVPFIQEQHVAEDYSDYWRFTSNGIARLFEANGLSVVFLASTPGHRCAVYHLCIASRQPDRWCAKLASVPTSVNDGRGFFRGVSLWL